MTVFLRTTMHRRSVEDGVIFLGAMFLGLVTHLFNGFAELAMSIAKLPIFYKQRDPLLSILGVRIAYMGAQDPNIILGMRCVDWHDLLCHWL